MTTGVCYDGWCFLRLVFAMMGVVFYDAWCSFYHGWRSLRWVSPMMGGVCLMGGVFYDRCCFL